MKKKKTFYDSDFFKNAFFKSATFKGTQEGKHFQKKPRKPRKKKES